MCSAAAGLSRLPVPLSGGSGLPSRHEPEPDGTNNERANFTLIAKPAVRLLLLVFDQEQERIMPGRSRPASSQP